MTAEKIYKAWVREQGWHLKLLRNRGNLPPDVLALMGAAQR